MTQTPSNDAAIRPGETTFGHDPADADDARLCFIGRIRSAHATREACPKNLRDAREAARPAWVEIDEAFRPALAGLAVGQAVHLLTWLHGARRELALQTPRHASGPRGTFALRSPVRPNPIGLHLVRIATLDPTTGLVGIDAIDVLDGTPLLDIKPYFESVDVPPPSVGPSAATNEDSGPANGSASPTNGFADPTNEFAGG